MKRNRFITTLLILALIVALGFTINLDYYLIMPSRAVELDQIVEVENRDLDDLGTFYLVTVSQKRATPLSALYGYLHPHIDLNPMANVIPANMDETEYRQLLAENMTESRHLAQVVALRRAGYEVEIDSDGVEVIGLTENAPAAGLLFEDDLIIAIDGIPVFLATEVPLLVQDRSVGEEVAITLQREGRNYNVTLATGANPEDEQLPYLGIFIKTLPWEPLLPIVVEMDTGRIGGPSAGLMFVLEILNQVLPEDLTGGYSIAGTGTIDINENVGRIGGVVQKVIAAENAGADYFILPADNYDQAVTVASSVELVPVENLQEVLSFLANLD